MYQMGLVQDAVWGPKTIAALTEIYSKPLDGVKEIHHKYATRFIQWIVGASIDGIFGNETKIKV
ncbi:hypothetical protein [Clostridium pasteurianum]|uniref:hypothetical protein n=1 Tax=Clostridium pasteurianum TaxID=1501 RepID=UPI0003A9E9E3